MITIIDISNMMNFDLEAAEELGKRLYELQHENLLNLLRPITF